MTIALFKERNFANALRAVIAVGILLAIYQYFFNRSLWIDEASLALNIINKSFGELLQPLDYRQVAPIGFLYVEKIFVNIFGPSEYALRLFPLLSFLGSVYLFSKLSRELIGGTLLALAAVAYFSINVRSVYFASEVKQYSTEVLMCIAIILSALKLAPEDKKSLLLFAAVGSISIWFSSAAVIVLFVSGLYVLYKYVWTGRNWRVILPVVCWVVSFVAYYFLFIYHHAHTDYMHTWWSRWFFPWGTDFNKIYNFFHSGLLSIFSFHPRRYYVWVFPACVALLGLTYLIVERRYKELYFIVMPGFVHLILSSLRLYPFAERLMLYLMPLTILLYTCGLFYLWRIVNEKIVKLPLGVILGVVVLGFVPWLVTYPLERQEMRSSIAMISEKIEDGDNVYVFGGGKRSFQYYHERDALLAGHHIVVAKNYIVNVEASAPELVSLTGNTWLVFAFHKGTKRGEILHPGPMIDWLVADGYSILSEQNYTGSRVYKIRKNVAESN
ncbi:MAG: hypothetical protein DRI69_07745 [Bacteroidetes bacterium]|nr:MAG: hypothetical protein DRI69_07745 [Bacteroidota bacterium]